MHTSQRLSDTNYKQCRLGSGTLIFDIKRLNMGQITTVYEADVSTINPSSERVEGLCVVCVYIGVEELCQSWKSYINTHNPKFIRSDEGLTLET